MKCIKAIGFLIILLLTFTPILSVPLQASDHPYNWKWTISIIIGHYTMVLRNSSRPLLIGLVGKFLVFGFGWFNPPGYAQPFFGPGIEIYPSLLGRFIGFLRNNLVIGLLHSYNGDDYPFSSSYFF